VVTIIVEDGTGLPDSNSYIDVSFVKKYAEDRGVDLGSDEVISANLILAADYMSTQGPFKGSVVSPAQALDFPRKGLYVHGEPFTGVPQKVMKAQAQLLLDIKESGALMVTSRQYALKKRALEGLVQEWAVGAHAQYKPNASHAMFQSLMADYKNGTFGQASTYR